VLGFARRHLNHDNAARRYLTTAIFPVYILHQTIIVVVAHALKPVNLQPVVEGPLLVLVTATGCLVGYEIIRRSALLRPLFGLAARVTPTRPLGQPERSGGNPGKRHRRDVGQPERSGGNPGKRHRRDVGQPVQHLVPQDVQ
jgi:hypothetical protein